MKPNDSSTKLINNDLTINELLAKWTNLAISILQQNETKLLAEIN